MWKYCTAGFINVWQNCLKKVSFWDFSHAVHVPQSVCLFLVTVEQNTSFVFQKFTAQMFTGIKVGGLRVMIFSCAQSVKCPLDKQGPPPLSLCVNELYFIGSLLMHSTNIFDQWCLILFLPTPFASATTIIHSSFRYSTSASSFFSIACFPHLSSF